MARAQFADILRNRREQLRLTIPQAAKVLRMRESVLTAFEAGDFEHLPALGYAQGMVSSYARYLGLDPMKLAGLYEEEHAEYIANVTGRRPTGLASLSDEPGYVNPASAALSRSRQNVTTSPSSTGAMRPTELPQRYNTYQNPETRAYVTPAQPRYSDQIRYGSAEEAEAARQQERRYTKRAPQGVDGRARRSQAERVRRAHSYEDSYASDYAGSVSSRSAGAQRGYSNNYSPYAASYQDDIETRSVQAGQYRDDLRIDGEANSYHAASTRAGRQSFRSEGAPQRPNVRRQSSSGRNRGSSRNSSPQTAEDYLRAILSDPQRVILIGVLILSLILLIILVGSVRSCIDANMGSDREVSVVTTLAASTEAASTASAEEQQLVDEAAAKKAASADAATYTETVVKVSVAEGATTWVEITCDGEQTVAESITGAWEVEYTVKQSITIQVVDPSSVTVEKNGAIQSLSDKSAGLSSITIQGTDPEAAAAATASTTDAATDGSEDDEYSSGDSEE